MKIKLVKIVFGDSVTYKYLPFTYCCEKMRLNSMLMLSPYEETQSLYCENCEYAKYYNSEACQKCKVYQTHDTDEPPCFKMEKTIVESDYYDSYENTYYLDVNYCPHCGEKIEITVEKEIDLTTVYTNLQKERDILWKKCQTTDSKKEEEELREKVHILDQKIDDFFMVGPTDVYLEMDVSEK